MRKLTFLSLVIAGLGASSVVGAGDIYCNNQGHDCSDRPSPGATFVGSTNSAIASGSEGTAAGGGNSGTPGASGATPVDAGADARLKQDASRVAVQKDVAATRADAVQGSQGQVPEVDRGPPRLSPEQGRRARVPVGFRGRPGAAQRPPRDGTQLRRQRLLTINSRPASGPC